MANLFPDMPLPPKLPIHEVYDRTVPGPAGEIPIRVFRPSEHDNLPVLIYLHGGGWTMGNLEVGDDTCRELANRTGFLVVSVDYRLAPEHKFPAGFDDVYAVVTWLSAHASELGGDASRLAIGGESAGANLTAAVTVHARDNDGPDFAMQLLVCPVTEYAVERPSWVEYEQAPILGSDDVLFFWDQYLRDVSDRTDPRATPMNAESLHGLPPAFVLTAEFDPIRDDGEAYAQRLADAGVPTKLVRYEGIIHGFLSIVSLERTQQALQDVADEMIDRIGILHQT
ncbi:alpha/beta hydrolase [Rhodococcus fascians]|nr:alpha/beta hydrolase [Rhodococcus fascians]MBY4140909.1 alpha/beta hydrolase [Rhodococcus fascians]MBY4219573.1 alpha/beta hydrolase [Rhodococcus fascians]MBY4221882.1 alpha/beta hydrolase [Rhodococcus fascians]MBY4233883.1 alpha/beta hydrolase [Rhodococcus fascians]